MSLNVSFDKILQFATFNGAIPKEGPKVWAQQINWAVIPSPAVFDFTALKMGGAISGVQGIFVDNSNNPQPITVTASVLNLPLQIPGNYQGVFPLFVTNQTKLTVSTTGTGTGGIYFLNFPVAAAVWPGINQILSFNGSGGLLVSDGLLDGCVVGTNLQVVDTNLATTISGGKVAVSGSFSAGNGALTDGSGTITVASTSQQIFAANAARKYLLLLNISAGDLWFNFTSAALLSQPSLKLPTGQSFVMESTFVSNESVNIIGATAGQAFVAKQG